MIHTQLPTKNKNASLPSFTNGMSKKKIAELADASVSICLEEGNLLQVAEELTVSMAFVNNQMAIAKKALNEKKVTAYNNLIASSVANEQYFAPSLAKDYISAKCSQEQYNYDLCERCSRSLVHTIDAIRTAISALKMEKEYA
jgi:hypothetical protein